MEGKALSREEILGIDDLVTEVVEVPEWGGIVHVRSMTAFERDAFEGWFLNLPDETSARIEKHFRVRLVALCLVNGTGERLFSEDDIEGLGAKSSAVVNRIFKVAQRLNGLRPEDIEDLAGN